MIPYFLGGPFWSFNDWKGNFYSKSAATSSFLEEYSSVFNTVEAGSTFYALPKKDSVKKWRDSVPDSFRFIFKIPKRITHELKLRDCQKELSEFLSIMEPVHDVTGMLHIQLSRGFKGEQFEDLKAFIDICTDELPWAVEVRHKDFFDQSVYEKQLDEFLVKKSVTRIHFNTSALFKKSPDTMTLQESQSKKPQNPDRWSVTTPNPTIRFISCDELDQSLKDCSRLLQATAYWIEQGLTPYILLHSPGNKITPELCRKFHKVLQRKVDMEGLDIFPGEKNFQPDLFG